MKIQVRLADIENGIPSHGYACAIVLAACREFQIPLEDKRVEVDGSLMTVEQDNGYHERFRLPQEAQKFVNTYDRNWEEAVPLEFEVFAEYPDSYE
jgi:hypothetical protein